MAWLAEQSKTSFRVVYDRLAARIQQLARIPDPDRTHRAYLYGRVTREQVVTALAQYYRTPLPTDCTFYNVQVDGTTLPTTVLTRPGWMSTRIPLGAEAERFEYVSPSLAPIPPPHLDGDALAAAINRLTTAELSSTVLTNDPLYRLLRIAVQPARLDASVTPMSFADYALTMDLLESELIETLAEENTAASPRARSRRLPLRDAYLPSVMHALDLERRIYAGGPVALLAAELAALGRATPGHRNRTLNRCAFKVYRYVAGGVLDDQEVTLAFTTAALAIGLTAAETGRTLASARTTGLANPRTLPAAPGLRIEEAAA